MPVIQNCSISKTINTSIILWLLTPNHNVCHYAYSPLYLVIKDDTFDSFTTITININDKCKIN